MVLRMVGILAPQVDRVVKDEPDVLPMEILGFEAEVAIKILALLIPIVILWRALAYPLSIRK